MESEPTPLAPGRNGLNPGGAWPVKSDMYLLRTDGNTCSRELVTGAGKLRFAYPSSHQRVVVWRDRPSTVFVVKKLGDELTPHLIKVARFLGQKEKMRVVVEREVYDAHPTLQDAPYVYSYTEEEAANLGSFIDFVVCLGGDGVILHAANLFTTHLPPTLCFHLGSLGFLTTHSFDEHETALHNVIYGVEDVSTCSAEGDPQFGVNVSLRMRLVCEVRRREAPSEVAVSIEVLNEVLLDRGTEAHLGSIEVYEAGRFITTVQADGLMLATPTGSSAYSVAAGGSLVHPLVPGILFTPICPHTLSFRPIILPDYAQVELRIPRNARCEAWASFDGKSRMIMRRGDTLSVRMSPNPVPVINKVDQTYDWIDALQRCFRWNDRVDQKGLSSMPLDSLSTDALSSLDSEDHY